ncbi:hypothetical protein D5086_026556 [Populus alba]|uniref:Uncharacterized protein n=1 Tax=Populus alba TaxID=43335 RepID=A0ACC4B263_POPAL
MTSTASSGMVQLLLLRFRSGLPLQGQIEEETATLDEVFTGFSKRCQSADPLSVSPLQISVHSKSPNSPRSPNHVGSSKGDSSKGIPKKGSPLMHERHFFSMRLPRKRQRL